ncbi:MAG: restriction endonuclease subunit S [Chitinophagales bacterium]|nr:restriction endonuclease subunit S [Chitinophagales bacterium]
MKHPLRRTLVKEEQNMNGTFKDWSVVKLGEITEKISNGANAKQSEEKIGYPISRIETIWNEQIDLDRVKYIQESEPAFIEKYSLKRNDVLFSHINSDIHLGKTAIFKNQTPTLIHGINLLLIRFKENVSADFINYQFKYKRKKGEFISIAQKSVNQSSINQGKLKSLDFVLPPITVQQQIVSKIEELFSELDKGIEELKTAQQQLKVYRQAVLKSAFEGKLTNEDVKEGELPKGWNMKKFGELFSETPQNGLYKPSTQYGWGVPIIRIDGFYEGVILKDYEYKRVQLSEEETKRYLLTVGDILINRVNSMSHLGKCGLVKSLKEKTVFESNIMKVRVKEGLAIPEYITAYLSSKRGIKELTKNAKHAVNQASINQTDVSNAAIPICSVEEQQQIVQEIESRLSVCDKIEETINNSLKQSEALRQSILKKAFEGKLV